jgi:hypothetical protein
MNINEEIKNITNYISKVEYNIELENKKLLTYEEINKEKEYLLKEIKEIDNRLIKINNDINEFSNNQKKIILHENTIYNNELKRLIDKRELIKEVKEIELKKVIKENVKLYIKKREILNKINYINTKINEFDIHKKNIRKEFINSVKSNNKIIKHNKTGISSINNIKDSILQIDIELKKNKTKQNNIINSSLEKDKLSNELELLNKEENKLLRKKQQLSKYLNKVNLVNISKSLLKNKLPNDYKEYKKHLSYFELELNKCNNNINKNLIEIEELEETLTDEYITKILDNEKKRCITRWNKINERINNIILEYKDNYNNEIQKLINNKEQLEHKYSILQSKKINKSTEINNELLINIKNRLKYLKKIQ